LNISAKYHQNRSLNSELYRFKVDAFFETQCSISTDMTLCWLVCCCCRCSWSRSDSYVSAHVNLLMPKTRPLNSLIISGRRCLSTVEPCPRHSASISP